MRLSFEGKRFEVPFELSGKTVRMVVDPHTSSHTLITDSGLEILRQASKGLPRQAGRILANALRLAVPKGLNHLPDDLIQMAIAEMP